MLKLCLKLVALLCLVLSSYVETSQDAETEANFHSIECHPLPSDNADHYIVGYGSLMRSSSKDRTYNNTGPNIPVQVKGFRREWNVKGDNVGLDLTYLGVVKDENSSFNGIIFHLPSSANVSETLQSYDERERFYCREQVNLKDIVVLSASNESGSMQDKYFWIYANQKQYIATPSKDYPIVQSYVDDFISGCLELEEKYSLPDFAKTCVKSTYGWSRVHWVNDRIYPRRPFLYEPKAQEIDKVLNDVLEIQFENIRIEG